MNGVTTNTNDEWSNEHDEKIEKEQGVFNKSWYVCFLLSVMCSHTSSLDSHIAKSCGRDILYVG